MIKYPFTNMCRLTPKKNTASTILKNKLNRGASVITCLPANNKINISAATMS
jgi:hypothetical protein